MSQGISEQIKQKGTLTIIPIPLKIGTRPKVMNTSTCTLRLLKDESGGYYHGHTPEELQEYQTLKVDEKFFQNYRLSFGDTKQSIDLTTERGRFDSKVIDWYIKNGRSGPYYGINFLVTDVNHATSETLYLVHDEVKIAETKVSSSKIKHKAMSCLDNMTHSQWLDYLHLIGTNNDLSGVVPEVAEARLIDYIEFSTDNAARFIEWYKNDKGSTQNLIDFRYAIENRVIIISNTGAYHYGDVLLGVSESAAIAYLNNAKQSAMKSEILSRTARARGIVVEEKEKK